MPSPFSSAISMTSRICSINDSRSLSKMNSLATWNREEKKFSVFSWFLFSGLLLPTNVNLAAQTELIYNMNYTCAESIYNVSDDYRDIIFSVFSEKIIPTMICAISSGLSPSRSNLKVTIFLLCVSSWHSATLSPTLEICKRFIYINSVQWQRALRKPCCVNMLSLKPYTENI